MSNKDDDFVRPPDKSKKMKLFDDDSPNEMISMRSLGHIFSEGTFDPFCDFYQTDNHYFNSKSFNNNENYMNHNVDDIDDIQFQQDIQSFSRNKLNDILIKLIFSEYDYFNSFCDVEVLMTSIQQYVDKKIDEIILESEICWKIKQKIDSFCEEDIEIKNALKNIFIPDSIDEYEKNVEIKKIEIEKEFNDTNISEKIQKQHELDQQEKKIIEQEKELKTKKRINLMKHLSQQLSKLGSYEDSAKELKLRVTPEIEKYIALQTENVIITHELYKQLDIFLQQIRMDPEIKKELKSVFQYIQ